MREGILEGVAADLPSIPPLIFREIPGKLIKTTLTNVHADITPLRFEIIRLLDKECKLHVTEIGNRLRIAKTQMTKLTDKLVDLQLVERQTDVTDRRT